ncbi:hypothetical protein EVAR_21466_1 [Eumeta japonica]|uniref:Uncharacterized protein n=1 Tax=Eumeta variegata TaxID=151549 RepID=A0A4C1VH47_EUMVA|nr:hypothetical protein EVAR_21466_1 [Eumeta japonica]
MKGIAELRIERDCTPEVSGVSYQCAGQSTTGEPISAYARPPAAPFTPSGYLIFDFCTLTASVRLVSLAVYAVNM